MMQNPVPSPGKAALRMTKPAGALKRDINLMPVNENTEKIARRGTVALFVLLGVLVLAAVVIYLPLVQLKALQAKVGAAENEALAKAYVEEEFKKTIAERDNLQGMLASLGNLQDSALHPADAVDMLSIACPDKVVLTGITLTNGEFTITGWAPADTDVSQFIVNLRSQPKVYGVSLKGVKSNPDGKAERRRLFDLTVRLTPPPTPTADPAAATAAPATKGGDGK